MAFVRRSRVVVRPNVPPKDSKQPACGQADIARPADGREPVQPEADSAYSADNSMLSDNGCARLNTDLCPSLMTAPTSSLNNASSEELDAAKNFLLESKEKADFVDTTNVVPVQDAGQASCLTGQGAACEASVEDRPTAPLSTIPYFRKSRVAARPNLPSHRNKADICLPMDVITTTAHNGSVLAKSTSVQSHAGSSLIDNSCVDQCSDTCPSQITCQGTSVRDMNIDYKELIMVGETNMFIGPSNENAESLSTAVVADGAVGHASKITHPEVVRNDGSQEVPARSCPPAPYFRRPRITVRPNLLSKTNKSDGCPTVDITKANVYGGCVLAESRRAQASESSVIIDNGCGSQSSSTCLSQATLQGTSVNSESGSSKELLLSDAISTSSSQLNKKPDVTSSATVAADGVVLPASNMTDPGIADGSHGVPVPSCPSMPYFRRPRVVLRPNLTSRRNPPDGCPTVDIAKSTLDSKCVLAGSMPVQPSDSSLLIDNVCMSQSSGSCPPQIADQSCSQNDESGNHEELVVDGRTDTSCGLLNEKADSASSACVVAGDVSEHACNMTDRSHDGRTSPSPVGSLVAVHPHVLSKKNSSEPIDCADFSSSTGDSGCMLADCTSVQLNSGSLPIDNGRASVNGNVCLSQIACQITRRNEESCCSELSDVGEINTSDGQRNERADLSISMPVVVVGVLGHANTMTDPGIASVSGGSHDLPVLPHSSKPYFRRPRVTAHPNLQSRRNKSESCNPVDTKAAVDSGYVHLERCHVQPSVSSLLIEDRCASPSSNMHAHKKNTCASEITGQTTSLTGETGNSKELTTTGMGNRTSGQLKDNGDVANDTAAVADRAVVYAYQIADPATASGYDSQQVPVQARPSMPFARRSRVAVRPNLPTRENQPDTRSQADVTNVAVVSGSVLRESSLPQTDSSLPRGGVCVSAEGDTRLLQATVQAANLNEQHGDFNELRAESGTRSPGSVQLEKADVANSLSVVPDRAPGHASNITGPDIVSHEDMDEGSGVSRSSTAFFRRSPVPVRPNLPSKGNKPNTVGQNDITKATQPESSSVQFTEGPLQMGVYASVDSDSNSSQIADQKLNLNAASSSSGEPGGAEGAESSSGQSIEKADTVSNSVLVPDRILGQSSTADPGLTGSGGSHEKPLVPSPFPAFVRRSRVAVRPNVPTKGSKQNACADADMTNATHDGGRVQPVSSLVHHGNVTLPTDYGSMNVDGGTWSLCTTVQAATQNDVNGHVGQPTAFTNTARGRSLSCQNVAEDVSRNESLQTLGSVVAAAADGGSVSLVEVQCGTVPTDGGAAPNSIPGVSGSAGSDSCVVPQDSTELPAPAVGGRPRARLKVRPNVGVADSSRAKQARHGGVTGQQSTGRQRTDSAQEAVAGNKRVSANDAETVASAAAGDSSRTVRCGAGSSHFEQAEAASEARNTGEATAEVIAASALSSAAPPPTKKQKMRRKVTSSSEPVDRTKMTMKELLYWNPTSNPMVKPPAQPLRSAEQGAAAKSSETPVKSFADDCDATATEAFTADPVPQVMVGEDGQLVLNVSSLVVHSAPVVHPEPADVAVEEHRNYVTSSSFRKRLCTKFWSAQDTCKFYKALASVGTDFFLMGKLFPKRSRAELKNKFKKEEKHNAKKVDAALQGELCFDAEAFSDSDEGDSDESHVSLGSAKGKPKRASNGPKTNSSFPTSKRRKASEEESNLSVDDTCAGYRSRVS